MQDTGSRDTYDILYKKQDIGCRIQNTKCSINSRKRIKN